MGNPALPRGTDSMIVSLKLIQPVLHDWCNKGRGMCYPVCGMMHIKEPIAANPKE